jgi:hypothetical protein
MFTNTESNDYEFLRALRGSHLALQPSAGNVGIGTTSPASPLEVNGNVAFGDTATGIKGTIHSTDEYRINALDVDENGFNSLHLRADGTDGLFIQKDTNRVGIGTSSPEGRLHIYNGDSSTTPDTDGDELVVENSNRSGISILSGTGSGSIGSIIFGSSDDANGAGITWQNYINTLTLKTQNTAGILRFASNNNVEAMRIDQSGSVGIGTTSPKTKLDVENTTAPTLDNDTHAGEAIFLRSGGSDGDGNVQAVLAFGKADGSSRRSGSAIASVQTDSDVDKVGIGFYTSDSSSSSQTMDQRVLIDHVGNMRFSDNGANPSASSNMAFIFNDGGEMKVLDELGNTTTISPHNFELIPDGASEDMAFAYHSTRHTPEGKLKKVNVDMMKLARLVEQLTGEKLVYIEEGE